LATLAPFASQVTSTTQLATSSSCAKKLRFVEQALKKHKMQDQQQPSQAGIVVSPLRQAMAPSQRDNILFLKMHHHF
ncbi:hypothetical protein JG687_00015070, partial [Phytophthora cactorum]